MKLALASLAMLFATTQFASAQLSAVGTTTEAVATEAFPIWTPEDSAQIRFNVLRKGKPFGTHILDFQRQDDGSLKVVNDIDLIVKFGPITAYRYDHESVEMWRDGQLVSLTGETRKDGKDLRVTAELADNALQIDGTNFNGELPADMIPSSHWDSREVFADEILSSEGGQALQVQTTRLGEDILTIDGVEVPATKFRLKSDLDVYLWYDEQGRWVKCQFTARGQTIEYVLESLY